MKTDAHPYCGTGNFGAQRLNKPTHEPDKRKGAHISWPASIISFNTSEDIEGE